ncbi:thioredoxin family protein [Pseudalkalibacillus caeni]|uniref:Thioredoxin family protein n=1 Tax=Exobacillus caeni TaxID=2574798 RepID=A0A5R9F5I4_9BACL|nr:thioredoxin family protein [Pseudalkalibacillus caeni]TLS38787.1 thioredoxin family protein [Pseudalkalibacillus caeni]
MIEVNESELENIMKTKDGPVLIFFHTPFCQTCKIARRMTEIALESLNFRSDAFFAANLNIMPAKAESFEIQSVPCLVLLKDKTIQEKVFAFRSVDYLYRLLAPYK